MGKVNYVMEGTDKNCPIIKSSDKKHLKICGGVELDKFRVDSYEVMDETNRESYSMWKGALGAALFGGLGAVAGIGGKSKKEYLVVIEWKTKYAQKSLLCLDEEYYKILVRSLF